jgi:hypothetical protein
VRGARHTSHMVSQPAGAPLNSGLDLATLRAIGLLKYSQQVEIVLEVVLHANRSSRRCASPARANADSADTPVTWRRIICDFTDRYVRDPLASIVLLDCFC